MMWRFLRPVPSEAARNAASREAVFEALRAKGIKAIKVVAADGSKANGEIMGGRKRVGAASVVGAALLVGLAVYLTVPPRQRTGQVEERHQEIAFTAEEYRDAFTNLEAKSALILTRHFEAIKSLDLDVLVDYKFIEIAEDTEILDKKVRQGYRVVDNSRMEVRDLFKSLFSMFPAECRVEREEAQRLYAETMDKLEVSESRIVKSEKALRLLLGNRGKWRYVDGKVVWSDAALANEFEYFRWEASPQQKPRATVIESQVVELPPAK